MEDPKLSEKTEQREVLCKDCGAKLAFAPGTVHLKCAYCGAENEIIVDEEKNAEARQEIDFLDFINNQRDLAPKQDIVTLACDACGAATTFDPNVVSHECAFCGNSLIVKNGTTSSLIQPKGLLPFKIDEQNAKNLFKTWLSKLWFAPNKLKQYARAGKLSGIYIPYWTYDANTWTRYTGQRGDDYQETETYTDSNGQQQTRTVTKTRWTYVSGSVNDDFDDVLVAASNSLPRNYVDRLEPWDLDNLSGYDDKFLSGFKAESYQVDVKDGFDKAKDKMKVIIEGHIRRDIGGDHQRISTMDTNYSNITFKHILLPIWLSAYQYNKKVYRFMVNGRTGQVTGERPYSWIKITLAVLLGLGIIGAIIYFTQ